MTSLAVAALLASSPARASNCQNDSTGLVPLIDLGTGTYQGFEGGLYPGGVNYRPAEHESAGVALGNSIVPLDTTGTPNPQGRIVFISIGMSNCHLEFNYFKNVADSYPGVNWWIKYVDCAQGGQVAETISDPNAEYWDYVDSALELNEVTARQVQVIWFKNANRSPNLGFPGQAQAFCRQLGDIMHILHDKFPNLKQVYLSSRTYGGYANIPLSPEPYAYETGFGVKWLIEAQIAGEDSLNYDPNKGPVTTPWLSWGPYLWADGMNPRSDGITWACSQFDSLDGTHPNPTGQSAVAFLMVNYFLNDATSIPWFFRPLSSVPEAPPAPRPMVAPNPAGRGVTIAFGGPTPPEELTVFDLLGRRIRRLTTNGGTARWDLADDAGRPVANGVYWALPSNASLAPGTTPPRPARIVVQRN